MTRLGLLVVLLTATSVPLTSQTPRFEVASVKPSPVQVVYPRQAGGRLSLALPLRGLIARAYGLDVALVVGGPPLMSRSFDISAKAESPDATPAEINLMLKSLLVDRFALKAHTELREADIWVLKLAKGDGRLGPRLKRSSRSCVTSEEEFRARTQGRDPDEIRDPCERPPGLFPVTRTGQPISNLVNLLKIMCCALIEDRTGLTGRFDWDVIEPMAASADPNAPSSSGPTLFITELERQLGLKVETAKGKVEFLVIDSVEPPTPD